MIKLLTKSIKRAKTYARIWWLLSLNAASEFFVNRATNLFFLTGKTIRFTISLVFLWMIREQIGSFERYTTDQLVIFFLTYHVLDLIGQAFFRGVYTFSQKIRSGEFDFSLMKPLSPLFQALAGKPDLNDALFLLPSLIVFGAILPGLNIEYTILGTAWYLLLLLNGFLIIAGLHILVLVTTIMTVEAEGMIWLYRDLSRLGQFPISVFLEPLRFALFFIVPIGMMTTIPAQVLVGVPTSYHLGLVLTVGVGFFATSLWLWRRTLRHYTSASS